MSEKKDDAIARAVGLAVALGSTWVANQVITQGWKVAFGHKPPKAQDEHDYRFGEVALAAAITGAVVALTRVLATRGMAKIIK